jgi:hypothetical protein
VQAIGRQPQRASDGTPNATARNRPRCTAWCSSTLRPSSPRPKMLLAPTCPSSSKTTSTPSSSTASWPTASCACIAATAARTSWSPSAASGAGSAPHAAHCAWHRRRRPWWTTSPNAELRALVAPQVPEAPEQAARSAKCDANCAHHRPVRLSWAKLLKRVFDLDLEHGPNCGGELRIIATILEQPVIEKIVTHLGLQARAPPWAPARCQALQAASQLRFITVQVARRAGLRGSAAREAFRDRWMWRDAND